MTASLLSLLLTLCLPLLLPSLAGAHEAEQAVVPAERLIDVDFSTFTLKVVDLETNDVLLQTDTVLPSGDYYRVRRAGGVTGTVRKAEMGPKWWPTPNMREEDPSLPVVFEPYAEGNAMGHCKLSIDFDQSSPGILIYVRIHGGAKPEDMGRRVSRSCIRVPNSKCQRLVELAKGPYGSVRVHFHY